MVSDKSHDRLLSFPKFNWIFCTESIDNKTKRLHNSRWLFQTFYFEAENYLSPSAPCTMNSSSPVCSTTPELTNCYIIFVASYPVFMLSWSCLICSCITWIWISFWASSCSFLIFASLSALIYAIVRLRLLEALSIFAETPLDTNIDQTKINRGKYEALTWYMGRVSKLLGHNGIHGDH